MRPLHTRLLAAVADAASRQFGLVTFSEMRRLGVSTGTVAKWVAEGLLHRIHPAVYAFGHATLTREARWMAGQLACAPDGRVTHWTAAILLNLASPFDHRPHITLPPGRGARRDGIRVHRSAIPERDRLDVGPWRSTDWARVILDCADIASRLEVEELLAAAHDIEVYDQPVLDAVIADAGGRRGLKRLIPAMDALGAGPPRVFRSRSERRIDRRLVALGLPRPEVNVPFMRDDGRHAEIDLYWPAARLGVELDGPQHELPAQRAHDEERDRWLKQARGIDILRYALRGLRVERIVEDVRPRLSAT